MPPSPGSSWPDHTGARPSPVLLVCNSRSRSPSPALDKMARCSGKPGSPIYVSGQIAPLGQRGPPTENKRAGTQIRPAKEGGSRCHRSGRRRIRYQARRARLRSRSRRKRPRAGSSRGLASSSAGNQASSMRPWPLLGRARGTKHREACGVAKFDPAASRAIHELRRRASAPGVLPRMTRWFRWRTARRALQARPRHPPDAHGVAAATPVRPLRRGQNQVLRKPGSCPGRGADLR
jgi:hypothetical protein